MVLQQFHDVQMNLPVTMMQMLQKMMVLVVMQRKIMIAMVIVQQKLTVKVNVLEQLQKMNVVSVMVMGHQKNVGMDHLVAIHQIVLIKN